jgi:hypothetical protein
MLFAPTTLVEFASLSFYTSTVCRFNLLNINANYNALVTWRCCSIPHKYSLIVWRNIYDAEQKNIFTFEVYVNHNQQINME